MIARSGDTRPRFPYITNRYQVWDIYFNSSRVYSTCRPGQAIANCYLLPKDLEDKIYEMKSSDEVVEAIINWFVKPGYQNAE